MSKWIAEFDLEDGDTMPEHMDLEYKGAKIDFYCKPLEQEPKPCDTCRHYENGCHWLPSVTPLEQEPCVTMKNLSDEEIKHFAEEMKKARPQVISQESCEDAINRQAVLAETYNWSKDEFLRVTNPFYYLRKRINSLPPVTPQPFINKSCVAQGSCEHDKQMVLDKIRAEIVELRSRQNVGVLECLDIIDKYRGESEG